MCGIAGYYKQDPEQASPDLGIMSRLLWHRGPDEGGQYVCNEIGLSMRRLSIIDLETGQQPMFNEDGSIAVVNNGEIYNYLELRSQLKRRGHRFRTKSDTEVLVHGYEEWGAELPLHLRGMFACAIWDNRKRSLILARDHFGIKPLYYTWVGKTLLFASEMKALLVHPEVDRMVDHVALDQYLSFLYIPEPRTIYASIKALPPAHSLIVDHGTVRLEHYWKFEPAGDEKLSESTALKSIQEVMEDSVRSMLAADVPLGVFLSGGLDSTSILAFMCRLTREKVQTFTVGFGERAKNFDELQAARAVAFSFKTNHHEFLLKPDVVKLLPTVVQHFDQPFANPTAIILYLLSQETRKHVKVALAGTGGDEVFGGYPRYKGMLYYRDYHRIPAWLRRGVSALSRCILADSANGNPVQQRLRRFAEGGALSFADCYIHFLSTIMAERKQALYTSKFAQRLPEADSAAFLRPYLEGTAPETERLLAADFNTYLPFNQLAYCDRMSMACSLEVRVPFVDQKVVEVARGITLVQKLSGGITKGLFRKAMAPFLPQGVLNAPKQGLNLPIALWFRGELRDWMTSLLSPENLEKRGYFRPEGVNILINEHLKGWRDHSLFLWALVVLEVWHQLYVDRVELTPPEAGIILS
jgi:asparagine synthase (glutamine-hydrolysing)